MALKAVILDLDLTLVASGSAEELRRKRLWSEVYRLVPELKPYEGVSELLLMLREKGIRIAIVTSSPRPYCERIIGQWKWVADATVCYHDTTRRKPHPDPIHKALERLGVDAADAIAVGDHEGDIVSAKAAAVFSVAALWGAVDQGALLAAGPDLVCKNVSDLSDYVTQMLTT